MRARDQQRRRRSQRARARARPRFSGVRDKAYSHALSIGRAALLARHYERAAPQRRGVAYRLLFAVRIDLVFGRPVRLRLFAPRRITLATRCCAGAVKAERERASFLRACAGRIAPRRGVSHFARARLEPCSAGRLMSASSAYARAQPGVSRAFYVLDWWLAAPSDDLVTWAEVVADRALCALARLTRRAIVAASR